MARTPRTLSGGGHAEAESGENIGQGKPREDLIKTANPANQQEQISEVLLTRCPSRFVGGRSLLLSRVCSTCVRGWRLRDNCTWCERVLSLKHRRRNEPEEYHRAQQSPHNNDGLPGNENLHG